MHEGSHPTTFHEADVLTVRKNSRDAEYIRGVTKPNDFVHYTTIVIWQLVPTYETVFSQKRKHLHEQAMKEHL